MSKYVDSLDGAIKFQKDRGLDKQPFDPINEAVMLLEENLELLGFNVPKECRADLSNEFVKFIGTLQLHGICEEIKYFDEVERIEHAVDSASDTIVVATGTIMKLGYNPKDCIIEVAKEINSRTGSMVNGKFVKDKDVSPYVANYSEYKIKE